MKKKNSFIRKAAEYMALLCSVAFALLLFFPKQTEAAITKQVTQSGFKLSGTETWNYGDYSDENYRYPIYYRGTQTENGMDYKCKVSLTFANKAQTPYYASLYLDDNPIYLDSNGSNVLYTETSFTAEGSLNVLEISFMYMDTPSGDIPFTISMEVQENRKRQIWLFRHRKAFMKKPQELSWRLLRILIMTAHGGILPNIHSVFLIHLWQRSQVSPQMAVVWI